MEVKEEERVRRRKEGRKQARRLFLTLETQIVQKMLPMMSRWWHSQC